MLNSCAQPLSTSYDCFLTDLDGVCYRGAEPIEFAAEGLAQARKNGVTVLFLTNNSSRPPAKVAAQLTALGIPAKETEVINSAQTGVALLLEHINPGDPVLALGGPGVQEALAAAKVKVVNSAADRPVAVLQGLSENITWAELSEAVLAINAGAIHVATNLDATLPKERGLMIGNGSLVAAVANATGVTPLSSGKPKPDMYSLAATRAHAQKPLAIGDRLDTDIAGANQGGFDAIHLLTGVNSARDVMYAAPELRPAFVGIDMLDVNLPAPKVTMTADQKWQCAQATAWVAAENLYVAGVAITEQTQLTLAQYRAAIAAVWHAIDQHKPVRIPHIDVIRD
ncbi:MAG: HAD-IIA family hydrolase [Trueperella sp.]|nr:HAD-IIA family hydrolase [Trueperella sp.]